MKKNILAILGLFLIVGLIFSGCSSQTTQGASNSATNNVDLNTNTNANVNTNTQEAVTNEPVVEDNQQPETTNTQEKVTDNTQTQTAPVEVQEENFVDDADKDGIKDSSEVVLGTDQLNKDTDGDGINDKEDSNPVFFDGVLPSYSGNSDFKIKEVLVENNYDPVAKKDASDHLEIIVQNKGSKTIDNFEVYYKITDLTTNDVQSCFVDLQDFTIDAGETKSIHIDDVSRTDHFRDNPNSLYHTSMNELKVEVELFAPGFAVQTGNVVKDAGGAEEED